MKKVLRVKDVMTKNPITAKLPGSRTEVLRLLVKHKITGVPVVRRDGTLAGFVARKHIFAKPEEEQLALLIVKDYPSISPNAKVEDLARLLVEGNLHHLPVAENNKLAGVVTPADLMIVVEEMNLDTPVEALVKTTCVPVHESTPLRVANEIMKIAKVFALPVLNEHGRLSGIITDRDMFDLSRVNGTTAISDLGLAEDEDSWTWEGLRNIMKLYYEERKIDLPKLAVKDVMVKKPVAIYSNASVSEAARLMRRNDFGQLPIKDSRDHLLAMLTELDVLRVLIR